ncbi:MAG TPA: hypothetical protein VGM88_25415 [Kofleriaceae bacterium]|jgi:hypothetical protein
MLRIFIVATLVGCWTGPSRPASPPLPRNDGPYELAALAPDIETGMAEGTRIANQQSLTTKAGETPLAVFQALADAPGLRVFVVEPHADAPELCELARRKVMICKDGACKPLDGTTGGPLVLCNAAAFRTLDVLITAEHAPDKWATLLASDDAFRTLVTRAEHEPAALLQDLAPVTSVPHLAQHWELLTLLLVTAQLEQLQDQGPPAAGDVCTNYATDTGLPQTDRWKRELRGVRDGAGLVADVTRLVAKNDAKDSIDAMDELGSDLALVAEWLWQRRVAAYLGATCPAVAHEPFALMRCTCRQSDGAAARRAFIPDDGLPFAVAARVAITDIQTQLKLDFGVRFSIAALQLTALERATFVIGRHACGRASPPSTAIPALEGDRSIADPAHVFYPTATQEAAVAASCHRR